MANRTGGGRRLPFGPLANSRSLASVGRAARRRSPGAVTAPRSTDGPVEPRDNGARQSAPHPGQSTAPRSSSGMPVVGPPRLPSSDAETRERRVGLTPVSLFLTLLVAYVLIKVQLVLVLVLLALVFATIIEHPVQQLERRHIPRGLGILAVYAAIIASLTLLFVVLAPTIGDQASTFREEVPQRLEDLRLSWRENRNPLLNGPGQDLLSRGINLVENPGDDISVPQQAAIGVLTGVGGGIVGALTIFVIAFYYLMEKAWLRRLVLLEIPPEGRNRVSRIWDNVEAKVGDWLRGQLTLCLVIGVTATIGYGILDVPFWPLLGLWAGLTEIIPIVGPWIGGVPAVVIALTQSWNTAFLVIGFIVVLQLTENTVLVPRIMRGAVGLTPLTVFVAILAGTQFLGIVGALLAIPIAAAVQVVLTDYFNARRAANEANGSALPGWRFMRGPLGPVPLHPTPPEAADASPGPSARQESMSHSSTTSARPRPAGAPPER